jgi:hypothetical protein
VISPLLCKCKSNESWPAGSEARSLRILSAIISRRRLSACTRGPPYTNVWHGTQAWAGRAPSFCGPHHAPGCEDLLEVVDSSSSEFQILQRLRYFLSRYTLFHNHSTNSHMCRLLVFIWLEGQRSSRGLVFIHYLNCCVILAFACKFALLRHCTIFSRSQTQGVRQPAPVGSARATAPRSYCKPKEANASYY